jgi:hypothetical protein
LPDGERLQQRIINNMENFTYTTDAKRTTVCSIPLLSILEAAASVLVKIASVLLLLPRFSRASADNILEVSGNKYREKVTVLLFIVWRILFIYK